MNAKSLFNSSANFGVPVEALSYRDKSGAPCDEPSVPLALEIMIAHLENSEPVTSGVHNMCVCKRERVCVCVRARVSVCISLNVLAFVETFVKSSAYEAELYTRVELVCMRQVFTRRIE